MSPGGRWVGPALAFALLCGPTGLAAQGRQGLLSLPTARLYYEVVGVGDPVVVVHGGPGLDHNYLRPGLDVLASSRALIYYDRRGTGRSEADLDAASISLDSFVEDIEELRAALGYERITVLGHSFGGLIALAYALAHPERVRALVLMDTVEPGSEWAAETARRAAASRTPADSAELADLDWWDRLGGLDVPTLVVHGRHAAAPVALAEALADALPRGRLAVLETGHFPYVEDPAGLAAAVAGFLAGLRP